MITIAKNDYTKPTEIRENVVQNIIDAFLANSAWSTCHMESDSCGMGYRCRGSYVLKRKGQKAYGFHNRPFDSDTDAHTYHECEMRKAFKILLENGYHIFKIHSYGSWVGYRVCKADFYNGGTEVRDFSERWE